MPPRPGWHQSSGCSEAHRRCDRSRSEGSRLSSCSGIPMGAFAGREHSQAQPEMKKERVKTRPGIKKKEIGSPKDWPRGFLFYITPRNPGEKMGKENNQRDNRGREHQHNTRSNPTCMPWAAGPGCAGRAGPEHASLSSSMETASGKLDATVQQCHLGAFRGSSWNTGWKGG